MAHNGFEQVLHSNQALGAAVLIHNNGNLRFALGHFLKQVGAALALRHKESRAHNRRKRNIGRQIRTDVFQQILYINNAQNIVQILMVERDSGIALGN